jgi:hypothetical protein
MNTIRYFLSLCLLFAITQTQAQQQQPFEKTSGDYTVHYSLFPSSFVQPDIAAAYGITRARDRVILNVSVRRISDGDNRAQSALVRGTSSDLIHSQSLEFREIREQGAIYYLAELRASSRATLYFDLNITPDPNAPAITVQFNREVFPEP